MLSLSFCIDGPPVPKGRPRFYNGIAITPTTTRAYEKHVKETALRAVHANKWEPVEGDYSVTIKVYRARRQGDLDNFAKSVTDACNTILWPDDKMITELHLYRYEDKSVPRVEINCTVNNRTIPMVRNGSDFDGLLFGNRAKRTRKRSR